MQKLRWTVVCVAVLVGSMPASGAEWTGAPAVGVDIGPAIPISKFESTVGVGGAINPWAGYRFTFGTFSVMPMVALQYAAFPTEVEFKPEQDVTDLLSPGGGMRFSLGDENTEIFFQALGNYYFNFNGPLNQNGGGFAISGGINYEPYFLPHGMALGLFARYDQAGIDARRGSDEDVKFLTLGPSLRYVFLPPPPEPPPPPPVVAPAPTPVPVKKKIVLRGVNFDFDKYNLRPDAIPVLDEAVRVLQQEPDINISVNGYTDSIGTEAYNQRLSERRANSVLNYLAEHGVARSRMTAVGHGESNPVATNATADGRAQNRRVELLVKE